MSYWPNMPEDRDVEMLGKEVVVQNPRFPAARWQARAIGIAMDPSIIIEYSDGHRMTLPLAWATLAPTPRYDADTELKRVITNVVASAEFRFDRLEDRLAFWAADGADPRTQAQPDGGWVPF